MQALKVLEKCKNLIELIFDSVKLQNYSANPEVEAIIIIIKKYCATGKLRNCQKLCIFSIFCVSPR